MQRSHFASLLVAVTAAVVLFSGIGCGGGGGTNSTSATSGNNGSTTGTTLFKLVATSGLDTTARDLSNSVEGETLTVQALAVDRTGAATLVPVTSLQSAAPVSVATVEAATSRIFIGSASSQNYTVSARANGQTLTATLHVAALGTRTSYAGYVRTPTSRAVAGATLKFFGPSDTTALATTTVGVDGRFQANVPSGATRFSINVATLTNASNVPLYYNTYFSNGLYYDDILACYPPLSGISSTDLVVTLKSSGDIPPPPTGCSL